MFGRWRTSRDKDLQRELRSHLKAEADEQQEAGLSSDQAQLAARRALGNVTAIAEQVRETSGWIWFERLHQDARYAMRSLRRTPGFTAVVILTLTMGIGTTTAMFSIVNAVLLNPLPYRDPERLVVIWQKATQHLENPPMFDSYRDFQIWRNGSHSFERLAPATWATSGQILTGSGPARDVLAMPVGIDFFPLLGIRAGVGRTFQPDDLHQSCVVVLKHSFWITTFGAQKGVIGRHISLDDNACTIVGVMPAAFTFYPDALSMWKLITSESSIARDPENANVGVFARLKPAVTLSQAQNELQLLFKNEHRRQVNEVERRPFVYPLAEQFSYLSGPNLRLTVVVLFGAVMFVLFIACVNIANLLLGRSLTRQKEMAVRAALGSGRLRLIRQLLTEGLLLSFAGAAPGTLLAVGAVHLFRALNPIEMPPGNPVSVNLPVLGFTCLLSVATAFLFGLLPAVRASRVDLADAFRTSGRSVSFNRRGRAASQVLVAAEIMLSIALLAGAGLLIASVDRLASVPLGFRTDRILSTSIVLPKWRYSNANQQSKFYREASQRAANLHGLDSAAFVSALPLSNGRWGGSSLAREGRAEPDPATASRDVSTVSISPDYFRVLDVPIERGRSFDFRDRQSSEAVAIVNQALASKYFPNEDPLGQHIRVGEAAGNRPWLTIVGISANEKDKDFFHEMSWQDVPTVFRPIDQSPPASSAFVLRTDGDEAEVGIAIQKQFSAIDPSVAIGEVRTLASQLSRILAYPRFRAIVAAVFAGLALLLAGIVLYGVLSQLMAQRAPEFGVRLALGAQQRQLLLLVMRQGIALTVVGLLSGLSVAFGLTRFLRALLYGVKAADPWMFATASALLLLVAVLAILVPAWRAAKIDRQSFSDMNS